MKYGKVYITGYLLAGLWLILAVLPAYAADTGRASGQFTSKAIQLKITDGYAFRDTPALGGKDKVIIAAVSNQGFVQAAIDEY